MVHRDADPLIDVLVVQNMVSMAVKQTDKKNLNSPAHSSQAAVELQHVKDPLTRCLQTCLSPAGRH